MMERTVPDQTVPGRAEPSGEGRAGRRAGAAGGIAFGEAVRTSLAEIWAHKLRSLLIFIGVMLGAAAVVINITIIEGVKVMVWAGIKGLGFDGVIFVSGRAPEDDIERKKQGFSRGLRLSDAAVLLDGSEKLEYVAAVRLTEAVVSARGIERRVRVYGVTPSYGQVHDRHVSAGRWLDANDQSEVRRVAVLGVDLAERLFGVDEPVGKDVRIGSASFRVVGVEARLGNQFANSGWVRREMQGVLIPLSAFRAHVQGGENITILSVKTVDVDNLGAVKSEVERLVRRAHHGINDFEVENIADEILKAEKEVRVLLRNWTIVLSVIAGISLLVGGVGIYSVLKISLAERLYELGLRKAMGASDGAILLQFLVESTTLSVLGALIGCVLATALTVALSGQFEAGLPLSPFGLALGIGFAVATGLFAGFFPSLAASRLTPVEALRG